MSAELDRHFGYYPERRNEATCLRLAPPIVAACRRHLVAAVRAGTSRLYALVRIPQPRCRGVDLLREPSAGAETGSEKGVYHQCRAENDPSAEQDLYVASGRFRGGWTVIYIADVMTMLFRRVFAWCAHSDPCGV